MMTPAELLRRVSALRIATHVHGIATVCANLLPPAARAASLGILDAIDKRLADEWRIMRASSAAPAPRSSTLN